MSGSHFIELEADAVAAVHALMLKFGETEIAPTVARAIGLARVASKYFEDGKLTVLDPTSTEPETDDQLVDIVVAKAPGPAAVSQAA